MLLNISFFVGRISKSCYSQQIDVPEKWDLGLIRRLITKPESSQGELRVVKITQVVLKKGKRRWGILEFLARKGLFFCLNFIQTLFL